MPEARILVVQSPVFVTPEAIALCTERWCLELTDLPGPVSTVLDRAVIIEMQCGINVEAGMLHSYERLREIFGCAVAI